MNDKDIPAGPQSGPLLGLGSSEGLGPGSEAARLVELLRTRNGRADGFGLGPVCDKAADEIERLRGCLLWLLWHHQGASSPTGQPIRRALGIDQHAPMTDAQIEAGQRFGVGA